MTLGRRRSDEDFSEEVRAHLEIETGRLVAEEGMSADDARAAARKAFGNVAAAQERFHESRRWVWIEQFAQDVRYALRGFAKTPVFVATSVLTLALGLGLLTVAFTAFNAYVLRPIPVPQPKQLYSIGWRGPEAGSQLLSWSGYEEMRGRSDLFDGVLAESVGMLSSDGRTLATSIVSGSYFSVLKPPMLLGRGLGPADADQPVAVLGYRAWQRLFAGDPAAVGRELALDDRRITIVGILRPEFGGLDEYPRDLWLPASGGGERPPQRVTARLRGGVTAPQAEAALAGFAARMAEPGKGPRAYQAVLESRATAIPLMLGVVAMLSPVFAAFALVLLTACANVSNAMLARAIARQREIAVRLSLGASRSRIVRQLLTEGLLIAVAAAAAALGIAWWALRAGLVLLFQTAPPTLASLMRVQPMTFDARVFLFAFAAAAATTIAFALVPALRASRQPLTDALRGQRCGTAGGTTLRSALVVAQVAVSMVLVVCALVLARNFTRLAAADVGYATAGVYSLNIRGENEGVNRIAPALAADPRVAQVVATSGNPLFGRGRSVLAGAAGGGAPVRTPYVFVSPGYFDLLRLPLTRGRGFRVEEASGRAPVAIVSDATARALWPGEDPVGRTIRFSDAEDVRREGLSDLTQVTVIGTASDVLSGLMVDGVDSGRIYLPVTPAADRAIAMLIQPRAASDFRPDLLRPVFRRLGEDPDRFEIISLDEMREIQMFPVRAAAWIGGLLGAIALALSISGLYAVLSYLLAQRTREIGIRMALGASAASVVSLVMRQCARLAGVGAVIGLSLAFAALAALRALVRLEAVSLLDAAAFATGLTVVLIATAAAAYQPARRSTRIDPAETLRAEA